MAAAACGTTNHPYSGGSMTSQSMDVIEKNPMTSPDVGGVMTAANQGEIEQAQAALPRLGTTAARDFANMMIAEHTKALSEARSTLASSNIVPDEMSSRAAALRTDSDRIVTMLNNAGTNADRVYMQSQVDVHQKLLNMIDNDLVPVSHGTLLAILYKQRASVAMHLDHARQILAGL
jgi:putative membrane protein